MLSTHQSAADHQHDPSLMLTSMMIVTICSSSRAATETITMDRKPASSLVKPRIGLCIASKTHRTNPPTEFRSLSRIKMTGSRRLRDLKSPLDALFTALESKILLRLNITKRIRHPSHLSLSQSLCQCRISKFRL